MNKVLAPFVTNAIITPMGAMRPIPTPPPPPPTQHSTSTTEDSSPEVLAYQGDPDLPKIRNKIRTLKLDPN